MTATTLAAACCMALCAVGSAKAQLQLAQEGMPTAEIALDAEVITRTEPALTSLRTLSVTAHTGEKPQSKLWFHGDHWWAVLPDSSGTWLWRLQGTRWARAIRLSPWTNTRADVLPVGDLVHILLFRGQQSGSLSLQYHLEHEAYGRWQDAPELTSLVLPAKAETATLAGDARGRLWVGADSATEIQIRWSDPPYTHWSETLTLAVGITPDDICAMVPLKHRDVGVLWSNQKTRQFGFRVHRSGDAPKDWSEDERPAATSGMDLGLGMSDDHLNVALSANGTLYAAVKTSYDAAGYPLVALLVRRPNGVWDPLYSVDDEGSRPIVIIDEPAQQLVVVYSSYRDKRIVCRYSPTEQIAFGRRFDLIIHPGINNVTSAPQRLSVPPVILATVKDSSGYQAYGVQLAGPPRTGP